MSETNSSLGVSGGHGAGLEELLPALPVSCNTGDDPLARPVLTAQVEPPLPVARPLSAARPAAPDHASSATLANAPGRTDRLAVASAACGLTAFVPVISQLFGLWFGAISLLRIRRARRQGGNLRGSGWAWTGMISSGIALLGWLALPALLAHLGQSFTHTTESLTSILSR